MAKGGIGDFLLEIQAWWRGNTWGTRLWAATKGTLVGTDSNGNHYYLGKGKSGPHGVPRRMVIYGGGYADPTTIPPGWYAWMHYRTDTLPDDEGYKPREWEQGHLKNLTGTPFAYRPDGSLLNKGERPRVTGDYDAWSPD